MNAWFRLKYSLNCKLCCVEAFGVGNCLIADMRMWLLKLFECLCVLELRLCASGIHRLISSVTLCSTIAFYWWISHMIRNAKFSKLLFHLAYWPSILIVETNCFFHKLIHDYFDFLLTNLWDTCTYAVIHRYCLLVIELLLKSTKGAFHDNNLLLILIHWYICFSANRSSFKSFFTIEN